MSKQGTIHVSLGAMPEKHEIATATILAEHGFNITFLAPINSYKSKTPDIEMDGARWEIKSPESKLLQSIERNLKRATKQSENIIFDMRRMKSLKPEAIRAELMKQLLLSRKIKCIIFINKDGTIEKLTKRKQQYII